MTDTGIEARRPGYRSVLANRQFRLLLGSYLVSWTGDWCYSIALTVWVVERTGSSSWVAAIYVMRVVPFMLFGALGGVLADRYDRRRLMVGLDLARGALMIPLVIVVAVDGPILLGAAIAFVANTLSATYRPTVVAATPRIVGEDDLAAANALETIVLQVTVFLGPALAALLISTASVEWAIGVNLASYFVSAVLVGRGAGGGPRDPATFRRRHRATRRFRHRRVRSHRRRRVRHRHARRVARRVAHDPRTPRPLRLHAGGGRRAPRARRRGGAQGTGGDREPRHRTRGRGSARRGDGDRRAGDRPGDRSPRRPPPPRAAPGGQRRTHRDRARRPRTARAPSSPRLRSRSWRARRSSSSRSRRSRSCNAPSTGTGSAGSTGSRTRSTRPPPSSARSPHPR